MELHTLYLIHFLIFAVITIVTFVVDVKVAALECPESPEGKLGGTNMVEIMLMIGGFAYIGLTVMSLLIFVLINYFAGNFMPGEFGSLGKLKNCAGMLLRLFMYLLTLVHWLALVPHLIFLLTYATGSECFLAAMGLQRLMFVLLPVLWMLQHLGGAVARTFIDIPTFLMVPEEAESGGAYTFFIICGP